VFVHPPGRIDITIRVKLSWFLWNLILKKFKIFEPFMFGLISSKHSKHFTWKPAQAFHFRAYLQSNSEYNWRSEKYFCKRCRKYWNAHFMVKVRRISLIFSVCTVVVAGGLSYTKPASSWNLVIYSAIWRCATSRTVPGSTPGGVTGFFSDIFSSERTKALGSTQPLVKMSTRNIPGDKGGRCVRLTTSPPSRAKCHENLRA
jgi:hypothetical protein